MTSTGIAHLRGARTPGLIEPRRAPRVRGPAVAARAPFPRAPRRGPDADLRFVKYLTVLVTVLTLQTPHRPRSPPPSPRRPRAPRPGPSPGGPDGPRRSAADRPQPHGAGDACAPTRTATICAPRATPGRSSPTNAMSRQADTGPVATPNSSAPPTSSSSATAAVVTVCRRRCAYPPAPRWTAPDGPSGSTGPTTGPPVAPACEFAQGHNKGQYAAGIALTTRVGSTPGPAALLRSPLRPRTPSRARALASRNPRGTVRDR